MHIFSFSSELLVKEFLTEDVVLLRFSCPEDFSFKAGQFVTLTITHDGVKRVRSYSILNPPEKKGVLELCVKIVQDGFASQRFLAVRKGDRFDVKGPFGTFFFDEQIPCERHVFIGTGTGVAPLYSMILSWLPRLQKEFILISGFRNKDALLFHEEFLALEAKYPQFQYWPCLSREEWDGRRGRVQLHLPELVENTKFYICGLKDMVLGTKELLESRGVPRACIAFERYD